jgi:hypothetical protein
MKQPKRTLVFSCEDETGLTGATIKLDVVKAASIKTESGMQFMYLEQKPGKKGFTLNWTDNLIPEGMHIKSITMERE